jgi:hypothetical protein
MWKLHSKYKYSALSKKENELSPEEKKSLLLNPPMAIPEKVKRYLDIESATWQWQETYYAKMKHLQDIEAEKEKTKMVDDKNANKTTKKRKRRLLSNENTTSHKSTSVLTSEQVEDLFENLEKEHRMSGDVLDAAVVEVSKLSEVKTIQRLRRTHTPPATKQTEKKNMEMKMDSRPKQADGNQPTIDLEEALKHEKKELRTKIVSGQVEMESLEEDVKKWIQAHPSGELHLEDGRVYIQGIRTRPKITKMIVVEAFSNVLSKKAQLKEGQMMMSWVRSSLEKL